MLLVVVWSCSGFPDGNTKIVGGETVEIEEAPFIVLIISDERPLCGASIISPSFVITVSRS